MASRIILDPTTVAREMALRKVEVQGWKRLIQIDLDAAIMLLANLICEGSPRTRGLLEVFHERAQSKAAFEYLSTQEFDDSARQAFLFIWAAVAHDIRRGVADDDILLDALWNLLPRYSGPSLRLYRGEPCIDFDAGRRGICWSSDRKAALIFAQGRNAIAGGGVLVETDAPPDAIIAQVSTESTTGWEFEHIVDHRKLGENSTTRIVSRDYVRVCPRSCSFLTELSQHEADRGEA